MTALVTAVSEYLVGPHHHGAVPLMTLLCPYSVMLECLLTIYTQQSRPVKAVYAEKYVCMMVHVGPMPCRCEDCKLALGQLEGSSGPVSAL